MPPGVALPEAPSLPPGASWQIPSLAGPSSRRPPSAGGQQAGGPQLPANATKSSLARVPLVAKGTRRRPSRVLQCWCKVRSKRGWRGWEADAAKTALSFGFALRWALASENQPTPPFPQPSHRPALGGSAEGWGRQHPWVPSTAAPAPQHGGISSRALCPCLPQPRAACPSRGSPVSHQLLMSILQAWDGGGRTAARPHLAPPAAPSSRALAPSPPRLCFALPRGPRPQECQSRGHKGPLCERSRQAGGRGPAQHPEPGLGKAAAEDMCVGSSCHRHGLAASSQAQRCPHCCKGGQGGKPPPHPLPVARRWEHPTATASPGTSANTSTEVAPPWIASGLVPRDAIGSATPRGEQEGWGRGAAAAGFGLFQQLPSQRQQQGMCTGWGFPKPGHGVLNQLFIAFASLPGRNGPRSSCVGPGATGVPTTNTLSGPCQKGEVSSKKGLSATSHLHCPPFLLAPSAMPRTRSAANLTRLAKRRPRRAIHFFPASLLPPKSSGALTVRQPL